MAEDRPTEILPGIDPLIERYDGFLIDQFGVLIDGVQPLPGAIEALQLIRDAGRQVVILSNSGKRSAANEARLAALGISPALYDSLLSSGEVAWRGLRDPRSAGFAGLGRNCLLFSRGGDRSALEGLDLGLVEDAADADFVFLAGIDHDAEARALLRQGLAAALDRRLPLLCTNPDLVTLDGPRRLEGPGSFARRYAQGGGDVRWVGKPHPEIFAAALAEIGLPPQRVAMVGDSLQHDIAGARPLGIDGILIAAGVHAADFAGEWDLEVVLSRIRELSGREPVRPTWVLQQFAPVVAPVS